MSTIRWTINGPYLRQSNHPVYLTVYQATPADSVYLKDGAIAVNSSNHFVTKYIESLYDTGSSAKKNIVTIICPHDADHNKPGISRLTGSGTTGGAVNHPGNITDYALESAGTGEVSNNGATFQGTAALYRKQNNDLKFYFVRKGRRFDSGDSPAERALFNKLRARRRVEQEQSLSICRLKVDKDGGQSRTMKGNTSTTGSWDRRFTKGKLDSSVLDRLPWQEYHGRISVT